MKPRRLAAGIIGVLMLAGTATLVTSGTASAAVQEGLGYNVTPAQPYLHNPDASDWTGSYLVNSKPVWCVDFAYKAPDSNEQYQPGQPLLTKWGTPLDPTVAAEISYLLLRYGNTTSADDSAALAHLLHSWTAAPQNPGQLGPGNDFRHIAYDTNYHYSKLPASAQQAVQALTADASANHGPWTATMGKPTGAQTIGTAGSWTVSVLNAAGKGVSSVPVTLTATDATLPGGKTTASLQTGSNGSPLTVAVTPTGPNPSVVATLSAPAAVPVAQVPVQVDTQAVVSTGGESQLTTQATTTAQNAPGSVQVTKVDANSKAPIVGAAVELTGADKSSPAFKQDGTPDTGSDGKPISGQTGVNGTFSTQGLKAPQQVCIVETAAPPGYEQAFDPKSPPSVCGTVGPGQTLMLTLTNVPNKVPTAIPAGGPPPMMTAMGTTYTTVNPIVLAGFGLLLLIGAGLIGTVVMFRRSARSRR
jgi:hypothetical protein